MKEKGMIQGVLQLDEIVAKWRSVIKTVKYVDDLKLGLRNISKRITSLIFLNIYTPPQHDLTHKILFPLK